jgi:hypothetical protein
MAREGLLLDLTFWRLDGWMKEPKMKMGNEMVYMQDERVRPILNVSGTKS